jgi:glycosyltransferase involved in cell wall biosynthesis
VFLVANISRIDAQKNQLLLLEAFVKLRPLWPESFLLLIGHATEAHYARRIQEFILANQLAHLVKVLPGLRYDDSDLVDAFHACDVFALPSVHEPFGIVALEAWSCGKPLVTSGVGGLRTLVEQRVNGLSFDLKATNAAEEFASLLHDLACRPEWRFQLGAAGLKEVRLKYDWRIVGQRLEVLYQVAEENRYRRFGP